MNKDEYIKLGFKEIPHFTVMKNLTYDLGRNRKLYLGCPGTPSEVIFICQIDKNDNKKITDLVCLHNWDYDGYMTHEKLEGLIRALTKKEVKKNVVCFHVFRLLKPLEIKERNIKSQGVGIWICKVCGKITHSM